MGKQRCKCCTKKCTAISMAIVIPLLIALAILIFFLFPRIPKHKEKFERLNSAQLDNTKFRMDCTFSVNIDNKNYFPIKIGKSRMEVWYKNETYVGTTEPDKLEFPKRTNTTRYISFLAGSDDPTVIAQILAGPPTKQFTLRGFIRVVYIGISIKINLNENFEVNLP